MMKYLITNARIWTADADRPWADTAVIRDKTFQAVGSAAETAAEADGAAILDMHDRVVIPSFIDPHTHVTCVARSMWIYLMPRDLKNFDDVLDHVGAYAREHSRKEVPYIYATSCPTAWMTGRTKLDIDRVVSDRPVLICDEGYHRCLINSRMLALLGIDASTPYDQENVRNYERSANGEPTGIVLEHAYEEQIDRMYDAIGWRPPTADDLSVVEPYLDQLTAWGIASVQDGFTEGEETLIGLEQLENAGRLHLHYYANVPFFRDEYEDAIARCHAWSAKYGSQHIHCDTIKYFLDGTNEIGTAASMEPFRNDPSGQNYGVLNTSEDALAHILVRLNEEGLNIQIHLVGDRAFHVAVNAVERAKQACEARGERFTVRVNLLHCECTLPEDRRRAADLGIMINVTPHWNGGIFGADALKYYGRERFEKFYSFRDFIQYGANLSVSSDTVDKEDMPRTNPFQGIQIGMTRHDDLVDYETFPCGVEKDERGLCVRAPKEERLTLEELLLGYTIRAALAVGAGRTQGSITPGKEADFLVLDRNIFETDPYELGATKVLESWFEGARIH